MNDATVGERFPYRYLSFLKTRCQKNGSGCEAEEDYRPAAVAGCQSQSRLSGH